MVAKTLSEVAEHIAIRAQYDNYVGGKWVPPVRGQYFENISPIDGKVVCECPLHRGGHRAGARRRARGEGLPGAGPRPPSAPAS